MLSTLLAVVFCVIVSCLSREALTTRKLPTSINMPLKPKFALVSWLEEGSVGIMPLTAARDRDKLHVGAIVPMKFQGKYYDAEILKISDNKGELNRDCKDLVEFKITREDLLADSESISTNTLEEEEITTTTSESIDVCPLVAEPPPAKRTKNRTKAAKEKPRKSPNLSSNLSDKAQAKITAAKARASRMFRERSSTDAIDISNKSSGLCEETSQSVVQQLNSPSAFSSAELLKMLENQKKEIEELQDALKKHQSAPPLPSTPQVRYAKMSGYNAYDENYKENYEEDFYPNDCWSNYSSTWDDTPTTSYSSTWDLIPTASRNPLSRMVNKKLEPYNSTPKTEKSQNPLQEKIELVEGYNVFISPRQLDETVASSGGRPTRLIRGLLTVFFDSNTLASSSALGSRTHPAIDPNIRDACIKYVQTHHKEVARTAIIDAINDKCAQCRRKNLKPANLVTVM